MVKIITVLLVRKENLSPNGDISDSEQHKGKYLQETGKIMQCYKLEFVSVIVISMAEATMNKAKEKKKKKSKDLDYIPFKEQNLENSLA